MSLSDQIHFQELSKKLERPWEHDGRPTMIAHDNQYRRILAQLPKRCRHSILLEETCRYCDVLEAAGVPE